MKGIKRFHPGVYLKETIDVLDLTIDEFSVKTGISKDDLSLIVAEKMNITLDIVERLAKYFDNSTNYWLNLQKLYDKYMLERK